MPNLLYLSQVLPVPPDSGPRIRGYHLIRELARTFDVRAICLSRQPTNGRLWVDGVELRSFRLPQARRPVRALVDHAASLLTGRVYTRFVYGSGPFRRAVIDALEAEPDLIHADSLDLVYYLPLIRRLAPDAPWVLDHHNVESRLLRSRAEESGGWRARYLRLQADRYEAEERRWVPRATLNVTVSAADRDHLRAIAGGGEFMVAPNGVDTEFFQPREGAGRDVVFLGGTEWGPNVEGMEFFGREVLPILRERGFDRRVLWIGRATERERTHYRERFGFELTGYVDDVREAAADAACTIVPLRSGSGTRLKITTAWGMGLPVVSTTIGAEGLAVEDGGNALIADAPAAFADAVMRVLREPELRRRMGAEARATAERRYSWHRIGESLREAYDGLAGASAGRSPDAPGAPAAAETA